MRWKGLLLDVDGTLTFRGRLIPGAEVALTEFRRRGLLLRFATNIDSRPPESVRAHLLGLGLDVRSGEVINPPLVALRLMQAEPDRCWHCLVGPDLEDFLRPRAFAGQQAGRPAGASAGQDLQEYASGGRQVDRVLVGYCPQVDYRMLNEAFRQLLGGADLVALQKGRYFFAPDGTNLDTGALVAALEYASGKQARVLGKPARDFFAMCLEDLGLAPDEVAVVGDDPASDVAGARAVGAFAILVRTGKSAAAVGRGRQRAEGEGPLGSTGGPSGCAGGVAGGPTQGADAGPGATHPDLVVDSVADVLRWL